MPSFTVPSQKIAPGTLPGPRITPEHVAPMQGINAANRAIQSVGSQYIARQERGRKEDEQFQVQEAMNAAEREIGDMLYKGQDALYNREGGAAKTIYDDGDSRMTGIHETYRESLQTEQQRREFDARFGSRRTGVMQGLGRQQENQRRVWRDETERQSDYRIQETLHDGVNDPNIMEQMLAESATRMNTDIQRGKHPDKAEMEMEIRNSGLYRERFIQLANSDPVAAMDFYDREDTQAALDSGDKEKLWAVADDAMENATLNEVRTAYKEGEKKYKGGGLPAARAKAKEISERKVFGDRSRIRTNNGYDLDVDAAIRRSGTSDVTANLIWSIAKAESNFKDDVESKIYDKKTGKRLPGAQGLMQIMPSSMKAEKERLGLNAWDASDAVVLGALHLQRDMDRFGTEDPRHAIAAYNAGPGSKHGSNGRGVQGAMRKAGSRDYDVYKKYLPKETRNYVRKVMENMQGAPLPERQHRVVENAAAAEVARSDSANKVQNTQPSDPGQQRAYAAALAELQGDPNFPSMKNDEIKERYTGVLHDELIDDLIKARDVNKTDPRYSEAMTMSKSIRDREGMVPSKPGDPTDMKHKIKYDQFTAIFDRELRALLSTKSNMPITREEVQALTERLFVDLEFRRTETFMGLDFLNPDTVVNMDYWELRRNGIPPGLDFTKTPEEEKRARADYAKEGIKDPTSMEVLDQIIYNRTPKR